MKLEICHRLKWLQDRARGNKEQNHVQFVILDIEYLKSKQESRLAHEFMDKESLLFSSTVCAVQCV